MMHHLIHSALALCGGTRFQRLSLRAVFGLGIAVWIGLIVQLNLEGPSEAHETAADVPPWRLTSICNADSRPTACINGCWVSAGDELSASAATAKVLSIDCNQVLLSHRGERVVLRIHDRDVRWDMFKVTR